MIYKFTSFFIILIGLLINSAFSYDINKIRVDYVKGVDNEKIAAKLYVELRRIENPSPVIKAYIGATDAVKAKHSWNPVNKLSFLKTGCKTLDEAVALSPNQIEIRFLRFSLAHYLPAFLGYSKHIDEDRERIIELAGKKEVVNKQVDGQVLKVIVNFLLKSNRCSKEEVAVLTKIIA